MQRACRRPLGGCPGARDAQPPRPADRDRLLRRRSRGVERRTRGPDLGLRRVAFGPVRALGRPGDPHPRAAVHLRAGAHEHARPRRGEEGPRAGAARPDRPRDDRLRLVHDEPHDPRRPLRLRARTRRITDADVPPDGRLRRVDLRARPRLRHGGLGRDEARARRRRRDHRAAAELRRPAHGDPVRRRRRRGDRLPERGRFAGHGHASPPHGVRVLRQRDPHRARHRRKEPPLLRSGDLARRHALRPARPHLHRDGRRTERAAQRGEQHGRVHRAHARVRDERPARRQRRTARDARPRAPRPPSGQRADRRRAVRQALDAPGAGHAHGLPLRQHVGGEQPRRARLRDARREHGAHARRRREGARRPHDARAHPPRAISCCSRASAAAT